MRHALALLILVAEISFLPQHARAQWQVDGVALCTAARGQWSPTVVSDGAGGAIVTWYDYRTGNGDIYAQRVDASGTPQWTADGVAICTEAGGQIEPMIVPDGVGGVFVVWPDGRSGVLNHDVYAQRVDASGTPQWTVGGVALCTATGDQWHITIVSDDAGGAIVAWSDGRSGDFASDIYAQRVNASGVPQWAADGVALCTATSYQQTPTIASDGAGGAIVTWEDARNVANSDIYSQRVNASGVPQWAADGVTLCAAANNQYHPMIVSDGIGGAIVTWEDYRPGNDLYVQRVSAAGVPQWTADGAAICNAVNEQGFPRIVSDGAEGAIVSWQDYRNGTNTDIYTQRVNALGVPQWVANGVALCTAAFVQSSPRIAPDGAGGAIVTWEDARSGVSDIYSQRVNALGAPQWTGDGVALCTAVDRQNSLAIVSDGAGGAIVTWDDFRSGDSDIYGPTADVYAQHVTDPLTAVAIASFDATEANGAVTLRSAFRSDLGVEAVNVYRAAGTNADPRIVLKRVDNVRGDGFEYVDRDVAPGQSYRYRIGVVDADGEFFSSVITVFVAAITLELSQNQPNPFNPTTTIRFVLPVREDVTLAIYDASGHLVRTLVNEVQGYGAHEVTWDGRDNDGATMGSGVYFYRLHAGKLTESKKMVLLK